MRKKVLEGNDYEKVCFARNNLTLIFMSKQTGLIRLDGKIGGISFYKLGGEDLARIANGPSRERILKDANFQRTRENNVEFGGSANLAKALRLAFANILPTMADGRLTSRLVKLFKEINLGSSGVRGQRSFLISTNRPILVNFEFNNGTALGSVMNAPYTFSHTVDRTAGTIDLAAFIPLNYLNAPAGATHFKLITAIGVLSDYAFDPATGHYEPLSPEFNLSNAQASSAVLPLNTATAALSLTATLAGSPTLTGDHNVIQTLGVEFYQRVDGVDYLFAQGNAMKVINIF